jgi:HPt (histidine-containing phosphotransfer) domain-containing protein
MEPTVQELDPAGEDTLTPLKSMLAPAAFREIVELYATTIRTAVDTMREAARRADLMAVQRQAHDLAGMCGQIGSGRSGALARSIETACLESRGRDAIALVGEIVPAAAETLDWLKNLKDAPAERP